MSATRKNRSLSLDQDVLEEVERTTSEDGLMNSACKTSRACW